MIKLITIDLDNTLWDSEPVIRKAEHTLAGWLGARLPAVLQRLRSENIPALRSELIEAEPHLRYRVSALRIRLLQRLMQMTGLDERNATRHAEAAFEVFLHARQQVVLYEQTLPLLQKLSHQYALISITNGNADLKTIGLHHYFTHRVSADDLGVGKPEPDIFLHALGLGDAQPFEAVHIGDHLGDDIGGAQSVGMHTIWFNPGALASEGETERQVRSLEEIPALIASLDKG